MDSVPQQLRLKAMAQSGQVWIDGKFVDKAEASVSVFDHGLLYGDGVFEGIRVYSGRILKLRTHLQRLFESAHSIYLNIGRSIDDVERIVRSAVTHNKIGDGYIRLIVTRGVGPLGVNPLQCPKASLIVITDSLAVYPAAHYEQGISLATASTLQKHPMSLNPRVKSLNYLPNMMAKLESIRAGADEAVLLNSLGFVTECVGENLFIVNRIEGKDVITTPPVEAGILLGVTRGIVMHMATDLGYEVREANLTRHDLFAADEIFLTGTGAEIVPVNKYDGHEVSGGKPGPVTRKLTEAYRGMLKSAPED
jgi:branched-chain amino acid aminotransferase